MVIIGLFLLGLCLGSFVNALVWRLHEQAKPKAKRATNMSDLSITRGRSMCPECKHRLATKDLLPVISWLSLGGKCRYCKKSISWQYPVVELLTAGIFVGSYLALRPETTDLWGIIAFGLLLGAIVAGVALTVYDFKWMLLPNKLVSILGCIGLLYAVVHILNSGNTVAALYNLAFSIVITGGLFYVLFQMSKGKWIGGGDVKMGAVLGLFVLRPLHAAAMLFIASLLGCFYAMLLFLVGKYKPGVHIPFGPFLLMATYLIVVVGDQLISYYRQLLLI